MSSRPAPRIAVLPEALAVLGIAAVGCETALALVGGLAVAGVGAAVLVAAALLAARYVHGAEAMDSDYRRKVRLVSSREPTLRYWDAAIDDARESLAGYELHLRPLLQRLYAVRLAERHGVSLYTEPGRAAALLGPELWPWIDPAKPRLSKDAPKVDPRLAPGPIPDRTLAALVERLETL
ncbi:hypothetical protein ACEZCY_09095 [Streptacidiphilus sp. N1-12]|uniref:Uncharacterized protein n=2 Tax=Streptacidiphilus alkalitolerans TaxID=3342712 RepID=A0ABV6WUN0_9ACTN